MGRTRLSEDERAARREADRQKAREAVEALKTSEGWQRWLALRRHFHRYSLANQLLIALQKPDATRVAGFRAWLKLGYAVRRGERAIRIWVPVPPSTKKLDEWQRAGADAAERPRTWFRLGPVFDRSQVEPLPPPAEPVPLDPPIVALEGDDLAWTWPALVDLGAEIGSVVVVEALPRGCGGSYDTTTLAIAINEAASVNQRVKTLVHELGHALVRAEPAEDEAPMSYDEEELVVESVAFTVCGSLGIDTSGYSYRTSRRGRRTPSWRRSNARRPRSTASPDGSRTRSTPSTVTTAMRTRASCGRPPERRPHRGELSRLRP